MFHAYKPVENLCFSLMILNISSNIPLPKIDHKRRKDHKYVAYADNFFLPFNLLAANTFLPPAVLILLLNP